VIVRYETPADVKAALLDGTLDTVWGAGVLSAQDLVDLEDEPNLSVFHSGDVQNTILLLNSGKSPLDDITIRKAIIHSVNKIDIIDNELGGIERPVDNIFPLDAPYCDLDLTPRWDYDFEKAILLNCNASSEGGGGGNGDLALILGCVLGAFCSFLLVGAVFCYNRCRTAEHALAELRREEKAISA
jgi:ABC-type transport system substrate-binding protein